MAGTAVAPRAIAALVAAVAFVLPAAASATDPGDPQSLENAGVTEVIVKRDSGLSASERAEVRADAGARLVDMTRLPNTEVVRVPRGKLVEALDELNDDSRVQYAEPNAPVKAFSADTLFNSQWSLLAPDLVHGYGGIDAVGAWTVSTGTGQTVGIADTGVDASTPDLSGQLLGGYDFVQGDATPADGEGHGTHVSGIVAAIKDNNVGIAGVAPAAKLLEARVLDSNGEGSNAWVANGFDYLGDQGARVVNASLGGGYPSAAIEAAISSHPNTLYVVAAGNDGDDNDVTGTYPCSFTDSNILCVGATDQNDNEAYFSNYGATSVDLFAPGVGIMSTVCGGAYQSWSGTSMATPEVTGAAADVLAVDPTLTTAELKQYLMDDVDQLAWLGSDSVSGGRLNAHAAVSDALANRGYAIKSASFAGNPSEATVNANGCDPDPPNSDSDADGVLNTQDNCPSAYNPTQTDSDHDGAGDACDKDKDNDGIPDLYDNCPSKANTSQTDTDHDGVGDACEPTTGASSVLKLTQLKLTWSKSPRACSRKCPTLTVKVNASRTSHVTVTLAVKVKKKWVTLKQYKLTAKAGPNTFKLRVAKLRRGQGKLTLKASGASSKLATFKVG
jgi:subtilisin family serine protease